MKSDETRMSLFDLLSDVELAAVCVTEGCGYLPDGMAPIHHGAALPWAQLAGRRMDGHVVTGRCRDSCRRSPGSRRSGGAGGQVNPKRKIYI